MPSKEELENIKDWVEYITKLDFANMYEMIEALERVRKDLELLEKMKNSQKERTKMEWISVEEKLPKEEENVYWCYTDAGTMCECRWTDNKFGLRHNGLWGWYILDVPQYQHVTHWMPLPEPPTDKEGE